MTELTNEQRSAQEVQEFLKREAAPYTAYLSSDGKRITTWMGETLATVVSESRTYKANFGNQVTPFRAKAIDGRMYYGRHNGCGMYLRMRPVLSK